MEILAELSDILLAAGAIGAGVYCLVLSRRLRRFTDLERGVGGAVAVLSAQVDDLSKTLRRAESAARDSVSSLAQATDRAEAAGQRLELLMASLHDLPPPAEEQARAPIGPVFVRGAAPAGGTS
ncbi:hypothetical protein [Rubellimicrobium aerolatum]|uniref:Chemotaxis protein n=1 Tax=Rubellimicrobium aerolatum TaxID=490979 RepID=A0ABW0S9U5_9RHOB|nr:hypothetical protein [Rubellimicrobium aerolatum]MBP1805082.1 hypothetical protein [Rubellimicrobium aerolatum]